MPTRRPAPLPELPPVTASGRVFLPSSISRWLPVLAWAALIFVLSAIPGDRYPKVDLRNADKGVHAIIFLPLGFLLARALRSGLSVSKFPDGRGARAIVLGALYGLSDEIHQIWVPFRSCSTLDWMVDFLAVAAGAAVWHIVTRSRQASRPVPVSPPSKTAPLAPVD